MHRLTPPYSTPLQQYGLRRRCTVYYHPSSFRQHHVERRGRRQRKSCPGEEGHARSERTVRQLHREGSLPRSPEPSSGRRTRQTEAEVGSRDFGHQGYVPDRVGGVTQAVGRVREGEGPSGNQMFQSRGEDR